MDRNSAGDPIASVDGGTVGWSIHAAITHCISTRRHLGDYHHGYTNFGACLLARLGMGIGRAGTWLDDSCASYGYGYPAYSYAGLAIGVWLWRRLRPPVAAYYGGRVASGRSHSRLALAVSGAVATSNRPDSKRKPGGSGFPAERLSRLSSQNLPKQDGECGFCFG